MYMHANLLNYQFYLLVLVVTTFVFIFLFLTAAVRAVSLVRPVPLFFFLFAVLYGSLWNTRCFPHKLPAVDVASTKLTAMLLMRGSVVSSFGSSKSFSSIIESIALGSRRFHCFTAKFTAFTSSPPLGGLSFCDVQLVLSLFIITNYNKQHAYKPSNLGQTDLVSCLRSEFISQYVHYYKSLV